MITPPKPTDSHPTESRRTIKPDDRTSRGVRLRKRVIYDFGMHNGDDIPYYLEKADLVVGVDANPALCRSVEKRYSAAIDSGSLFVVNCAVGEIDVDQKDAIDFFIHRDKDHWSQLPAPTADRMIEFERIRIRQSTASSIIARHGEPYYIKLDIEHSDHIVLNEIRSHQIRPDFVSAEMHNPTVYGIMKSMGYRMFNVVEGAWVERMYRDALIVDTHGLKLRHSFPFHSAGPFGVDIRKSPWMKTETMDRYLKVCKPGWRDLHASAAGLRNSPESYIGFAHLFILRVHRKLLRDLTGRSPSVVSL